MSSHFQSLPKFKNKWLPFLHKISFLLFTSMTQFLFTLPAPPPPWMLLFLERYIHLLVYFSSTFPRTKTGWDLIISETLSGDTYFFSRPSTLQKGVYNPPPLSLQEKKRNHDHPFVSLFMLEFKHFWSHLFVWNSLTFCSIFLTKYILSSKKCHGAPPNS